MLPPLKRASPNLRPEVEKKCSQQTAVVNTINRRRRNHTMEIPVYGRVRKVLLNDIATNNFYFNIIQGVSKRVLQ
jgi:hypothetical protein